MTQRRTLRPLASALSLCLLLPASSTAARGGLTPITACGQLAPGDAVLMVDLDCTGYHHGVEIGGGTLDLNGHTIRGAEVAAVFCGWGPCGLQGPGALDDNANGFLAQGPVRIENATLSNNRTSGAQTPKGGRVLGSTVTGNGGFGLSFGEGARVVDSVIRDNGGGIRQNGSLQTLEVFDSEIAGNLAGGVSTHNGEVTVRGCDIRDNSRGVEITSLGSANVVRSQLGENRGMGLSAPFGEVDVSRSTVSGNGYDGIVGLVTRVAKTTVNDNGRFGVRDRGDGVDIQGSEVLRNGTSPLCGLFQDCADVAADAEASNVRGTACENSLLIGAHEIFADGVLGACALD